MSDLRNRLIRLAATLPSEERGRVLGVLKEGMSNSDVDKALQSAARVLVKELSLPRKTLARIFRILDSGVRKDLEKLLQEAQGASPVGVYHPLRLGDILVSSWGYEQTNIDFYEVIAVLPKTVKIRQLESKIVKQDPPHNYVVPVQGRYRGPAMRKKPNSSGRVKINSYSYAHPWSGRPEAETMSQFGH